MRVFLGMASSLVSLLLLTACVSSGPDIPINQDSISAGSRVLAAGQQVDLYPGSLKVGDNFLEKAKSLDFTFTPSVTIINVVPSLDTIVCEEQTHILGNNPSIKPNITRMVISRDLPQAQKRFALDTDLEGIIYLSDYKEGAFGKATGLLIKGSELLTRGVIVLDQKGIVRYMQLVSRLDELPDMKKAIDFANGLGG